MSGFEELGLMAEVVRAVEDLEWYLPRPIQAEAIPLILGGGDVMCAAETGSGKTGAFCLPAIQVTWESLNRRVTQRSSDRPTINREDCMPNCKISMDGLLCQCHDPRSWSGARCTFGVSDPAARWYYEATVEESGGIIRVGWSTASAGLELGKDAMGFGYGGTGKKSFNNSFDDYGGPFDVGDVIGAAIDLSGAGSVTFYKNGVCLGAAFSSIPGALRGEPWFPALCVKNSQVRLNFGPRMKSLPDGHRPVSEAAGPEQDKIAAAFQRRRAGSGAVGPTTLILEPTLELAQQVVDETMKFTKYLTNPAIRLSSVTRKRPFSDILTELKRGANVVVGTPGSLEAFVDSGELRLDNVRFLVVDEADRFASEYFGFISKLHRLAQAANQGRTQVCMFSATLHSPEILQLSAALCPRAVWVDLKGKDFVPETVHHGVVWIDPKESPWTPVPDLVTDGVHAKDKIVGEVYTSEGAKQAKPLALLRLIDAYKMEQCLIFARTRLDCDNLSRFLSARGGRKTASTEKGKENLYSNAVLHSGLSTNQRGENLALFKEGAVRFLICTDVAARGIDIAALPYVVNMCLPDKPEDYIHRIGRTGRADRMGLAIAIVSRAKEKVWYHTCPSRGEGCTNTDIAAPVARGPPGKMAGGCCVWFDEPAYALAIQQRLGQAFDELDPVTLRYHLQGADDAAVAYGRSREEDRRVLAVQEDWSARLATKIVASDKANQATFLQNRQRLAALFGAAAAPPPSSPASGAAGKKK